MKCSLLCHIIYLVIFKNALNLLVISSRSPYLEIVIRILGEAKTHWMDAGLHHGTEEEYFKTYVYLFGSKNGPLLELAPGTHTYSFTCTLPSTLPPTYESEYGHIRYGVKLTMVSLWSFYEESKVTFTVISPLNLNLYPRIKVSSRINQKFF